jgi:hypothetical protein
MNTSIEQSRLYGFNQDLLRHIYEYDNTRELEHRRYFFENIRQEIWSNAWIRWSERQNLYIRTVMEHIMAGWGVYFEIDYSEYYICQVFPSELHFVECIEPSGKYFCTVYYKDKTIFTGWVLDENNEQLETFGDGNWTEHEKIHVFTDYINRLYVYQSTSV